MFTKTTRVVLTLGLILAPIAVTEVYGQTPRALERRAERNERQAQRQINRADYYSNQAWTQLNPWITRNGVQAAAAAAANTNVRVSPSGAAVTSYGYGDSVAANEKWFYDRYQLAPTYYTHTDGSNGYGAATRYYDSDNDGVYDTSAYYRDSDNDGVYDQYDRLDFTANDKDDNDYQGPAETKQYTVKGKIEAAKKAQAGNEKHLVVQVKQADDSEAIVDLGPSDNPSLKDASVGASVVAVGSVERIGDKKLLVADSATVGDQNEFVIRRSSAKPLNGQIVDVQKIDVHSVPHYVSVIETGEGRQLVDLGPATTYKGTIKPSTAVVIHGIPVRTHGHTVIMADQVEMDGQIYAVNRSETVNF